MQDRTKIAEPKAKFLFLKAVMDVQAVFQGSLTANLPKRCVSVTDRLNCLVHLHFLYSLDERVCQ